jgi:hypothetical protein
MTWSSEEILARSGFSALCMDEFENLHSSLGCWRPRSFYYYKSTDKGNTWSPEQHLSDYSYAAYYGDCAPINSITAHGDIVFTTWVSTTNGTWDIFGMRSTDGGTTWEPSRVINDITSGGQCKGYAHFDQYGGLHVTYYHTPDWQPDSSSLFELRYQYSPDSGVSFRPSMRVSDTSVTSLADFLGDYHITRSDNQYLYAIWADGRNGDDNDLYFSKALLADLSTKEIAKHPAQLHPVLKVPAILNKRTCIHMSRLPYPIIITAYDVIGRSIKCIYAGIVNSAVDIELNPDDFPQGVIFIRFTSHKKTEVHKVINIK